MVPDVKKLGAELEAVPLVQWKRLEKREIPVLESRTANDVPASIPKSAQHGIGREGARVEEGARNAWSGVRIANAIGTSRIGHIAAPIGV